MSKNKIFVKIDLFYIAPDGTILWPKHSECGCEVIEPRKGEEKNEKPHLLLLVDACDFHYQKASRCMRKAFVSGEDIYYLVDSGDLY